MELPSEISKATTDVIIATAPAVATKMLDITKCFYGKILPNHPELLLFFYPAALAGSVVEYATNITDMSPFLLPGGPLDDICHRHCALAILPTQYVLVHGYLMGAIGEVLVDMTTPEISLAWSEAIFFLAKVMIDREESLYRIAEKRSGGWSGFAEFTVTDITPLTSDVKQINFKPVGGSPLEGSAFEFTAGQYLTMQIDMDGDGKSAPRHYTCTSPMNADYLQCCVKKISGGKLSTYVHEKLKVGDRVALSAPFGVFTPPKDPTSVVLVSAGIGIAPMVNLHRACKENVALVAHVDATPESHARRGDFAGTKTLFRYTKVDGKPRPKTQEFVDEVITEADGLDHDFYVCGPEKFVEYVKEELQYLGAKKVVCEVFGYKVATGCPFHQTSIINAK